MKGAAKALLAGLVAFIGALAVAAADHGISMQEWLTAASAGLVALGSVYKVPNTPSSS